MNVELPAYLYKYHPLGREFNETIEKDGVQRRKNSFDALEDILLHGKIHFSKPVYFNDPFELEGVRMRLSAIEKERTTNRTVLTMRKQHPPDLSRVEISQLVRAQAKKNFAKIEKELDQEKDRLLYRCGYISLSATNEEKLMWTHYADAHRGVCLRFKCDKDSFYEDNGAGRVIRVTYGDEILEKEYEAGASNDGFFLQASRKAECWAYEQEYRVFRIPSTPQADDAHGNHDFNSDLVNGVYFGLSTSKQDKERIREIVASSGRQISVFKAIRHPDRLEIIFQALED